ncbi:MAG: cobyric acid synthase CobQ, partial [Caldilineaceae bacterium]|nr:cobyric acid synthase CobQ [Caldilineaceae bacterium]
MNGLANVVMVQGTSSHAGKSVLATALCRIFAQDGYAVAPFKAQNMSLNSFVTPDGGEIGRSQAVQAAAAMVEPRVEMNPVLLKPETEARSQVVVLGRPQARKSAREYYALKQKLWGHVTEALATLRR